MIPLHDENPAIRPPIFTVTFIVVCCVVFLLQLGADANRTQEIMLSYGLVPAVVMGHADLPPYLQEIPIWLSFITSMFMHGGWMHLIGNMLFLWIFGNNIEDVLGHGRFVLFYLISGLGAAAAQIMIDTSSEIPMVGASGAISGVLGAYIILFPRARVLTLLFLGIFITTIRIRAVWFLGGWFGLQALNAAFTDISDGGVAWWAHIGGFIAGAFVLMFLKPKRFIFGGGHRGPWH